MPKPELVVFGWNVNTARRSADVRAELTKLTRAQHPDVIVLAEAYKLHGHLGGLGYQIVQYAPRKGSSEEAEVAILIRNGIKIRGRLALRMRLRWKGPKAGKQHSPRVYRWVRIQHAGRVWKIGGFHLPFGQAQKAESTNAVVQWFRQTATGRPAIAVADWNINKTGVSARVGKPAGAKVVGQGIDLAAYRSCRLIGSDSLGYHGSDHPVMRYRFAAASGPAPAKKPAPAPVKPVLTVVKRVLAAAAAEVGYREGRDHDGNWNNDQKYSKAVPGLAWSNWQPWCATFVCWDFWKPLGAKAFGTILPYRPTASCDAAMAAYKRARRWSEYPAIGAQVFFGRPGDAQHTGIVVSYTASAIETIEGNTNASGSYQGDGVYRKTHLRRDARVLGYGYPAYPEGIVSADPTWKGRK